jgi:transcriptional regulator with XRE-family HTH domain
MMGLARRGQQQKLEKQMKKNTLGPTIKALRKMKGITQAELALAVGLDRTSITNIERGNQTLTDVMAAKMAEVLGYRIVVKFERL